NAYLQILMLDVHYDLSPRANPRLRELLGQVREENMATAVVQSSPEGAFVTLSGEFLGVTPMVLDGLLAGESYEVSAFANGYQAQTITLHAVAGTMHEVDFQLVELPATVNIAGQGPDTTGTVQIASGGSQDSGQPDIAGILGPQISMSGQGSGPSAGGGGASQAQTMSTADLVNILSSGGGFDMAALASSGALSSQRPAVDSLAGSHRVLNPSVSSGVPVPVVDGAELASLMVFSETASQQGSSSEPLPGSSRSSEEIMEVLAEKRPEITFIYNKHLRSDPMLMGTVMVEMVIEPSGRVSRVDILESTTYNPAFELELAQAIETWRFGAVDSAEDPLTVLYPFSFSQ
ncbi:TonB family protein, partial [Candidatus Fermentibacteria bacterium]|nr:TonB family protein [Candidatus Fermentibacteria bacterium]